MKNKTVAVIPVYNHGETVGDVVSTLRGYGLPVILVDDGSNEDTARRLDEIVSGQSSFGPPVKLVRLPRNRGKGAAVMTGFRNALARGATHVLQVDADGQHGLEVVPRFLDASEKYPDAIVSGSPLYDATVPRLRLYGRYLTHVWIWINTLSAHIADSMCGFRIYPLASTMKVLPTVSHALRMDFDPEVAVRLDWEGVPFINLPVAVRYPLGGLSHFRVFRDNLRISLMHARLFFGMLRRSPKLLLRHLRPAHESSKYLSQIAPRSSQHGIHWARIGEAGFLGGMRFMLWVHRHGGDWAFRACLFFVTGWYFLFKKLPRRASLEYLDRLHKESGGTTPAPTWKNSFRHFMRFGESLLDKLTAIDTRQPISEPFHGEGLDILHRLYDEGRGALIIAAHFGNLELCRRFARKHRSSIQLTVLAHTRHAKHFNRLMRSLNPNHELEIIQVDSLGVSNAMQLSERIAEGGLVIVTGDRVPVTSASATMTAPFLGKEAHFPVGPYILGAALGCPVLMMFSARSSDGFAVTVRQLADRIVLPRRNRAQAIQPYLDAYADALSEECKKHPFQWFNFFPFWQPPAHKPDGQT